MASARRGQVSHVVRPFTVFLDLSWPGRAPGRVKICVDCFSQSGRDFLAMCTGQHGPSYRGTRLSGVGNKGQPGESVGFGYDKIDVFSKYDHLNEWEWRKERAGDVSSEGMGPFSITTRDFEDDEDVCGPFIFGEVVEGLHVVAEAAHHSDIREVTVVDCGRVV